jgi:threonyl-tRNA synthetase
VLYSRLIPGKPRQDITVTLPDSSTHIVKSYETTPLQIALSISKSLANDIVIAKVNGELWDLGRPLELSCTLKFLKFDEEEGKAVYWHSSAHVLGEAAELYYGCLLSHGPPTSEGFFYDMAMGDRCANRIIDPSNRRSVAGEDYSPLEKLAQSAMQEKQPFQRLDLDKPTLLEMFKYSKYKVHFINDKIPDGGSTTVYRCGPLIDLCTGPHILHTGRIKSFSVMKVG